MTAFEMAEKYYRKHLWSKSRLKNLVKAEKLTAEEYKEITGEEYEEQELEDIMS